MKEKKTQKLFVITLILFAMLFLACFTFAKAVETTIGQQTPIETQFKFPWSANPSSATPLSGLVKQIYLIALGIVGALALGMIIFGGLQYSMSAGDPGRQKDARDRITQALWGVVLLLAAYLILKTINLELVNLKEPNLKTITAAPPITAPSITDVITHPSGTKLSEQEVRAKLAALGIKVNHDPCSAGQTTGCTNLEGLRENTIYELASLRTACPNAEIVVTAGTEGGHAEGPISHSTGYKVDLRPTPSLVWCLGNNNAFTPISITDPERRSTCPWAAPGGDPNMNSCYKSPVGGLYVYEKTGGPHYDVTAYPR